MEKLKEQKNIDGNWMVLSLKDLNISVVDGDRGTNYPKQNDFLNQGHCLFLNAGNVTRNGFNFLETSFITEEKDKSMGKGKLKKDDIVITTRGTIGNIAHFSEDIIYENIRINSGMAIIRNSKQKIITNFLLQYFNSLLFNQELKRVAFGSAQPQLTINIINKFKIKIPEDKLEQNRIVSVLETWDSAIENLNKKIEIKKQIKKGLMQDLLTGKKRLSGFKDKWEVVMLGDICNIKTGKKDVNEGNPNGKYPFFTCAKEHTYSDNYSFDTEAILIAGNGEVGNCLYYKGKFEAYQRTYVLSDFKRESMYIYPYLNYFFQNIINSQKQMGAMPYIKLGMLQEFEIKIPKDLDEQKEIAEVLTITDKEITELEKKLSIIKDQKKYLLNNLITGAIRTPENLSVKS